MMATCALTMHTAGLAAMQMHCLPLLPMAALYIVVRPEDLQAVARTAAASVGCVTWSIHDHAARVVGLADRTMVR